MNDKQQFMNRLLPIGGCLVFPTNQKAKRPYRSVWFLGKVRLAHRVAFELFKGEIPDGMFVCHSCDNPPCCNPDHLFLGTHKDNMRDMHAKGRHPINGRPVFGERNGKSKLTKQQVSVIRDSYSSGCITHKTLAGIYGVSKSQIQRITSHDNW